MSIDTRPEAEPVRDPRPRSRWSGPPVRWQVFLPSVLAVTALAVWAMIAPTMAESLIATVVGKVTTGFGWFYIMLTTVVLVFVLYLGFSRHGNVRLGPDHSRPQFSTFSWASMLFAAGIGTDLMFYSVVEPMSQYMAPPSGQAESVGAAREATVWTLFHYGITGWALYALMGLALAYFAYRAELPLAVRSVLHPVFGKRIDGVLGHAVDTAAVLGTVFGIATSLGIGVVFLNVGLNMVFGLPIGLATQITLAVMAVVMAGLSAVSGVYKGIRLLSLGSVLLAIGLAAWVLVTGRTTFLLNAVVMNVGDFVRTFPSKTLETFAFVDNAEWMSLWTLFFWAWWIAWACFVGQFLARISRGRTIRQCVFGAMVIPFVYIVMWISIFGNAAIDRARGGDADFAAAAQEFDGRGFFLLLESYPLPGLMILISVGIGLLMYVSSADSGALVMGNLCSRLRSAQEDAAPWMRIVWALVTGLLTIAMLAVGGILALQYATIIFAVPFAIVLVLVMWGLHRALRMEQRRVDSGGATHTAAHPSEDAERESWKDRIARVTNFVDAEDAERHLDGVVAPALDEVAAELSSRGVRASARRGVAEPDEDHPVGGAFIELATDDGDEQFRYRVQVAQRPVPTYGGRIIDNRDQYARLEVHLAGGGQDYDVMGYTRAQVIHDCLDAYERYLEFLRLG